MRLFFIHSRLQYAVSKRIAADQDVLVLHRGLSYPGIGSTNVFTFKNFVLADLSKFSLLLRIIKERKIDEIFFPHSHQLNAFLVCCSVVSPKTKIRYLEDGATTLRFLLQKDRTDQAWVPPSNLTTRLAISVGLALSGRRTNLLRYVLQRVAKNMPVSQYLNVNSDCLPIYTSANLPDPRAIFVDITPRRDVEDTRYQAYWAFFLSPRYLEDDGGGELVDRLDQIVGNEPVLLVLHPTFWKPEKRKRLEIFYTLLEQRKINFDVFDGSIPDEDITFSLYLTGCRKYIFIDTSAELTMAAYESYFAKARSIKIQVGRYNGEEIAQLAGKLRQVVHDAVQ